MKPLVNPAVEPLMGRAFEEAVNRTAREIEAWPATDDGLSVGMMRRGEAESVGRQSARRIVAILNRPRDELSDVDYPHMRKVVGFGRRRRT